jgi:UDP-glucose 4-epimerase
MSCPQGKFCYTGIITFAAIATGLAIISKGAFTTERGETKYKIGASNINQNVDKWPKTGNKHILVAGGAGYIASHTIVCLLAQGYDVTVVDNLVNSNLESIRRVRMISGCEDARLRVYICDMCNADELEYVFKTSPVFYASIQFAGLKAVGESVSKPLLYYENNLISTFNLLKLMEKYNCHNIVFSSSATVYGSAAVPITETTQVGVGITNPYGRTKYMIEEILSDWHKAHTMSANAAADGTPTARKSVVILRYFNPVGAHPSGLIGEDPNGVPNNLMPFVSQVCIGRRPHVNVFGNDYDTRDGTGVRDYIHVMDLAEGHVSALRFVERPTGNNSGNKLTQSGNGVYSVFNLGTGTGVSVLEMINAMSSASKREIKTVIAPRREGDIATCYADPTRAKEVLGWIGNRSLQDMCNDLWKWQSDNPNGYSGKTAN